MVKTTNQLGSGRGELVWCCLPVWNWPVGDGHAPRIQAGFWAAMGFPVTNRASRHAWYKCLGAWECLKGERIQPTRRYFVGWWDIEPAYIPRKQCRLEACCIPHFRILFGETYLRNWWSQDGSFVTWYPSSRQRDIGFPDEVGELHLSNWCVHLKAVWDFVSEKHVPRILMSVQNMSGFNEF